MNLTKRPNKETKHCFGQVRVDPPNTGSITFCASAALVEHSVSYQGA